VTRVLITGASGYVGSRLAARLRRDPDVWVRALDRSRPQATRVEADDHVAADLAGGEHGIEAGLDDDPSAVDRACHGIDTVVHLAGPNEVVAAEEPDRALTETIVGTRRLAEAARRSGVRRILYVSTVHVYGARVSSGAKLREDDGVAPKAAYAIARLASEHLLAAAAQDKIEVVVFRLTNAVGAPASPSVHRWSLVGNDLCRQAATTGGLCLRTSGAQWRDFVPLSDVCRVLAGCLPSGSLAPGTYNLASGTPRTVRQLAGMVQDACESAGLPRPELRAPEPSEELPRACHVSTERLAAAGWRLDSPLEEAVAETLRFCLDHCRAPKAEERA